MSDFTPSLTEPIIEVDCEDEVPGNEEKPIGEETVTFQNAPLPESNLSQGIKKLSNLVGNTPLVPLGKLLEPHKYTCQIYAKCEFRNPSGTSWDRLVVSKISESHKSGQWFPGSHFVTGGNKNLCTSLAWAGSSGNFPVSVLPGGSSATDDGVDDESNKNLLLKGFGANVILSYKQDPFRENTRTCLESHIKQLETTSGITHHSILPFATEVGVKVYAEAFANELPSQVQAISNANTTEQPGFDLIVCGGDNKCLVYGLIQCFQKDSNSKTPVIVGVNLKENSFADELDEENEIDKVHQSVVWTTVPDAEAIDMTRRLIREEGLTVGYISGAVMAAAMIACNTYGFASNPNAKVLVILPDSLLQAPTHYFLSTDWMVAKGYYDPKLLESLLWWYEMALENINPPVVMTVPPDAPVKIVWKAMSRSLTERAVIVEKAEAGEPKTVIGIVTYDYMTARVNAGGEDSLVKDICYKQFGVIDSKQSLADLEVVLRKFHWIVKMHRIPVYGLEKDKPPQIVEDVIGLINLADFMRYKRKIEAHHLKEYGVKMSDGMPSQVWVEKFNKPVIDDTAAEEGPAQDGNQNLPQQ